MAVAVAIVVAVVLFADMVTVVALLLLPSLLLLAAVEVVGETSFSSHSGMVEESACAAAQRFVTDADVEPPMLVLAVAIAVTAVVVIDVGTCVD